MAWRDRLQQASFRGVPFDFRGDDLEGVGRRNQKHEYPLRDTPMVTDLGRGIETITVEARLIGPDYLSVLDRLLAALRAPGPGELVHPFYGRLQVMVDPACRVQHSFDEGGMCSLSLVFVEAGEQRYPVGGGTAVHLPRSTAARLDEVARARFEDRFKLAGLPAWVTDGALTDAVQLVGDLPGASYPKPSRATLVSLLGEPGRLAVALAGIFSAGRGRSSLDGARYYSGLPRHEAQGSYSQAQRQVRTNRDALLELLTHSAVAASGRDVTAVDDPVYDDLVAWDADLTAVVDRELERPGLPQGVFSALSDVRGAVSQHVLGEASSAVRLRSYTPRTTVPARVLAYDLYEDAARADELVSRNGLRHPGFVPPEPIKVLGR